MRIIAIWFVLLPLVISAQDHASVIKRVFDESLTRGHAYSNLRYLCKNIGHRLSGSPQAAAAVEYTRQLMDQYGFDTVYLQPVMVPHWVRGEKDVVRIIGSEKVGTKALNALALGNSIGTGTDGITAEVVEVSGIDEVNRLGKKVAGKIVFYNGQMDPTQIETFSAYGGAVSQRSSGASEAGKYGAKAVVIRSISNRKDDIPHTGALNYKPLMPRIPALAISTNDADLLSALLKKQPGLKLYVESHGQMLEDVLSYNVIGEIRGTEKPEEIIAVGGHLDSWDVGEGAHDDGAGCMQAIEAVRLLLALGIKPKRTLRTVMWMNEENGLRGGKAYARVAKEREERHIAAIESDAGGFRPIGFSSLGTEDQRAQLMRWKEYFLPYHIWQFDRTGGGADIGPLLEQGVLLIGLRPDSQRYFIYHHTPADVFEAVDQRELELGAAAMSALIYLIDQEGTR